MWDSIYKYQPPLKHKIAFTKGWNQATQFPLPSNEAIEIALNSANSEEHAYRIGINLARDFDLQNISANSICNNAEDDKVEKAATEETATRT